MMHYTGSPCGTPATDQASAVRCRACLLWLRDELRDELLVTENLALVESIGYLDVCLVALPDRGRP